MSNNTDTRLHELAREHPEAFQNVADRADDDLQELMFGILSDLGGGDPR